MWTVEQLKQMVDEVENGSQLPKGLMSAVAHTESRWDPTVVSKAGATGLFQFMPKTAKGYGVDPTDPQSSAIGARRMLEDLWKSTGGDLDKVLASYNWGSGNVAKRGMENMPAETRNYIAAVRSKMGGQPVMVATATQVAPTSDSGSIMPTISNAVTSATDAASTFGRDLVATVNSFLGRAPQAQGATLGSTEEDVRRQIEPRASMDDVRRALDGIGALEKPQTQQRKQAPTKRSIKQRLASHENDAEQLLGTVTAMGFPGIADEQNPLGDLNSVNRTEYMAQLAKMLADFKASPEGFDLA